MYTRVVFFTNVESLKHIVNRLLQYFSTIAVFKRFQSYLIVTCS